MFGYTRHTENFKTFCHRVAGGGRKSAKCWEEKKPVKSSLHSVDILPFKCQSLLYATPGNASWRIPPAGDGEGDSSLGSVTDSV